MADSFDAAPAELPVTPPKIWQFSFTPTAAEFTSACKAAQQSQSHAALGQLTRDTFGIKAAKVLLVVCLFALGFGGWPFAEGVWLGLPLLTMLFAALWFCGWLLYAEMLGRVERGFASVALQPHTLSFTKQGVTQTSLGNVSICGWHSIAAMQVTPEFFLLIRPASVFYVPLRCFDSLEQRAAMQADIAQWQAAEPYQALSLPPAPPMTRQRRSQFVVGFILATLFATQAWWTPLLWRSLYMPMQEERASGEAEPIATVNPADEPLIYGEHQAVLQTALDAIAPGTPGKPELYAVVLGGDSTERVFAREVAAISTRLKGTAHSTTALLNSRADATSLPLATVTALKEVLGTIGERMNKDEDMLLLYLSSHGSKPSDGHELLLNHPPLQLQQLTPAVLREALDAAGITHRVVIVSACYAGGYIDTLKSDSSIVLAASRADRTSFGCGDDSQWTYFGEALWQDQRFLVPDIRGVFETAKAAIAVKEKAQDFEPSEPQASFGATAEARWRSLFAKPSEAAK